MKKNFYSSWEKKLRRLLLSLTLLFGFLAFGQTVPPYENGDYRSLQSGAWNSTATWQVYNGTTWVAATSYPGQNTSVGNQGDYKAIIQAGHDITVSADATYYFGDLYILGSPIPDPTVIGKLQISGNQTDFNLLGTDQNIFLRGGAIEFTTNNTVLGLLSGNSLIISNFNGNADGTGGTNGVRASGNCTGNQQITFYDADGSIAQMYAVCNGNNSDYNFDDLNAFGGSLAVHPVASPLEICVGGTVSLSGTYTGFIPAIGGVKTIHYEWTLVEKPINSTYTFSPVSGEFPHPGGMAPYPIPSPTDQTLPTVGTYIFSLTAWYYYEGTSGYKISSTETVTVTVKPQTECACYNDPTPGTGVPSKFGITSLGRAGSDTAGANWPMVRTGAHMVLEANTKGFVITRITDTGAISNPVKGMIVYDISNDCLSVYDGTTWACFEKPSCP